MEQLCRVKISLLALSLAFLPGVGQAITYDFPLEAGQEVPAPTLGGATPTGSASLSVNTITGDISINGSYAGLTSNASASHLHGLAAPGANAGVLQAFSVSGGTAGSITSGGTLSGTNLRGLLEGQTYVNLHTANNGPGELRGQVVDPDIRFFDITLDPSQEVPPPTLGGFSPIGSASVVVDITTGEIEVSGSYTGMTSSVVAAHLHGLAGPGTPAGVIFGFTTSGGTAGTFSGTSTLSSENLAGLLNGETYLNVHTANNGPGEIRGQVVPEPGTFALILLGALILGRTGRG